MPKIIQTEDGSHSLHSNQFDVSYHSIHGAIQETQTVFIDAALDYKATAANTLSILEIGFGTGLNAFMTFLEAEKRQLSLQYMGVEAYPITLELAKDLNYSKQLKAAEYQAQFLAMHAQENEWIEFSPNFTFFKKICQFQDLDFENEFDIIYFDAFAPSAQPELWEEALLSKMYAALKPTGVLSTYCAKGVFKRCLKQIGFQVEALPGPIGKREITRALK